MTTAANQLAAEIKGRMFTVLAIAVGMSIPNDEYLHQRCDAIVDQLTAYVGSIGSRDGVAMIGLALFGGDLPRPTWWSTPLGLLCARSVPDGWQLLGVSQSEAAEILGVHKGTVATLVKRGTLAKAPEGGVSLAAVLDRLVRLAVTA